MELQIKYLVDIPSVIKELSELFIEEWGPYYGKEGPGDAMNDLKNMANKNNLPIGLVALDNTKPVGFISLKSESITVRNKLGPWIASFIVKKEVRCNGIGNQLIKEALTLAKAINYTEIYSGIRSEDLTTKRLFLKNGFELYENKINYFNGKVDIIKYIF